MQIAAVGETLASAFSEVIEGLHGSPRGPVELGRTLGVDKVLTSRLLKAVRNRDPIAVAYLIPGPEPLRRVLRGAAKRGVDPAVLRRADAAIGALEMLIRREAGDRSGLDAMISAWLPDARAEFELRRKQSAFKAMSQLIGVMADINLSTVMLHPNADGTTLDVVWIFGLLGLRRLRPGVVVKYATRRLSEASSPRHPQTLDGVPVEGLDGLRLDEFCSAPPAKLNVQHIGDVVHYTMSGEEFGPNSAVDFIGAEVNLREMPRYVPREKNRKGFVFSEVGTPARELILDVLVHDEVYPDSEPSLHIYDTVLDGVADLNDRARDIDRLDLAESVQCLGRGLQKFRAAKIPNYAQLMRQVCEKLNWDGNQFRGYRCRIEYPIYGSQVAMAFDPPEPPDMK